MRSYSVWIVVCLLVCCLLSKKTANYVKFLYDGMSFHLCPTASQIQYCHPKKKKYKQVWWQFLLWLHFIAWWMVKNTIHTLYMTYNIHCNYCCIFLSSARKNMSTCQKICQHARWFSTCKIIMWIMLTSY